MARPYKSPVDYRASPSITPSPEAFVVLGGLAVLQEAPADPTDPSYPMRVWIGAQELTRVTDAPATSGQYRVRTQLVAVPGGQAAVHLPVLEFHASVADNTAGTCEYHRAGTILTSPFWDSFVAFISPLVGYATMDELPEPTMDVTRRGRPGDSAFLDDGTLAWSNGSVWNVVAGVGRTIQQAATGVGAASDVSADSQRHVEAPAESADAGDAGESGIVGRPPIEEEPAGTATGPDAVTGGVVKPSVSVEVGATSDVLAEQMTGVSAATEAAKAGDEGVSSVVSSIVDAITSPAGGTTVSSPVTFTGTAATGTGVTAELWDEA